MWAFMIVVIIAAIVIGVVVGNSGEWLFNSCLQQEHIRVHWFNSHDSKYMFQKKHESFIYFLESLLNLKQKSILNFKTI